MRGHLLSTVRRRNWAGMSEVQSSSYVTSRDSLGSLLSLGNLSLMGKVYIYVEVRLATDQARDIR